MQYILAPPPATPKKNDEDKTHGNFALIKIGETRLVAINFDKHFM